MLVGILVVATLVELAVFIGGDGCWYVRILIDN